MPATRHAVRLDRFGEPAVMRWVEEAAPEPAAGEVAVEVDAIGVNFADTMVRRGEYRRDQSLAFTPGFEAAGRVAEDSTGELAPGTPVAVFAEHGGAYATRLCAPRDHVHPLPDGTDPVVAAGTFLQGVTAWYAVERFGRVAPGETVLVHAGAGGVGGLCTQLCVAAGATVIATASLAAKREAAAGHGAAHVLPADADGLADAVRDLTGGRGCDVVLDGVGGPLFAPSLRALALSGRYVVIGSSSQQPAMLDARGLMPRGQTVVGFVVARVAERDPAEPQRALEHVLRACREGRLRPDLSVVAAHEVARVHEAIESRRQIGKVVLDAATLSG